MVENLKETSANCQKIKSKFPSIKKIYIMSEKSKMKNIIYCILPFVSKTGGEYFKKSAELYKTY